MSIIAAINSIQTRDTQAENAARTLATQHQARVLADAGTVGDYTPLKNALKPLVPFDNKQLLLVPQGEGVKVAKLYSQIGPDMIWSRPGKRHVTDINKKLKLIDADIPAICYDAINGAPVLNTEPQATNLLNYPITMTDFIINSANLEGDDATLGAELVTNGSFTGSATGWVLDAGATYGTNNLNINVSSVYALRQNSILTPQKLYKVSFTISNYVSGSIGIDSIGSIKYRSSNGTFTFYSYAFNADLRFFCSPSTNLTIDDITVKELQGYSAPSVDFPTSALKLTALINGAYIELNTPLAVTLGSSYSNSIYVKRATGTGNVFLKNINAVSQTIAVTNEWQDFSQTIVSLGTTGQTGIVLATAGDSVYVFHPQSELGTVKTSRTFCDPTLVAEGATSTRLADSVNGGIANIYDSVSGVLNARIRAHANDLTVRVISLSDGTLNNRVVIYYSALNEISAEVIVGGVLQCHLTKVVADITAWNNVAIRYEVNNFALAINGVIEDADLVGITFPVNTLTKISFNTASILDFYGDTDILSVYATKTDAELVTLTS